MSVEFLFFNIDFSNITESSESDDFIALANPDLLIKSLNSSAPISLTLFVLIFFLSLRLPLCLIFAKSHF